MFEKIINNKLFKVKEIAPNITMIIDVTGVSSYLVKGTERALLIDTCCGIGDIKKVVDKICKIPYDVVLTHLHFDHVGGAYLYDEVFIAKEDGKILRQEYEREYNETQKEIDERLPPFIHLKVPKVNENTKLSFVKEGDQFELGGRTLEVIAVPGHTKGSIVLLDIENRILFTGDAASARTLLIFDYSASIPEYQKALIKLTNMRYRYDKFYTAHPSYLVDGSIVDDLVEICEEIIEGKNLPYPYEYNGKEYCLAKKYTGGSCNRDDGKIGNIVYKSNEIYSN